MDMTICMAPRQHIAPLGQRIIVIVVKELTHQLAPTSLHAGNTRLVMDDGNAFGNDAIEQGGLADVRAADDCDDVLRIHLLLN